VFSNNGFGGFVIILHQFQGGNHVLVTNVPRGSHSFDHCLIILFGISDHISILFRAHHIFRIRIVTFDLKLYFGQEMHHVFVAQFRSQRGRSRIGLTLLSAVRLKTFYYFFDKLKCYGFIFSLDIERWNALTS